jgi:hypothetical protein
MEEARLPSKSGVCKYTCGLTALEDLSLLEFLQKAQ